jgi:DNA polymerase-3 subunit beta
LEEAPEVPESTIFPTKFVASLSKLLDEHEGDIRLTIEQGKAIAVVGDAILTSKLVEGTYPQWRRVVPINSDKRLLVGVDSFDGALRRASLVCNERSRIVKIELSADKMTISATSQEQGTAVEEIPCSWDSGDFAIGFSANQLREMLRVAGEGDLQVDLTDAASPPLFSNPADDSAKWVVMPFRV